MATLSDWTPPDVEPLPVVHMSNGQWWFYVEIEHKITGAGSHARMWREGPYPTELEARNAMQDYCKQHFGGQACTPFPRGASS